MDRTFEIAEQTHADCVAFTLSPAAAGTAFAGRTDLNMMCAVAHEVLRRRLAREGIRSVLVAGCFEGDETGVENHVWLEVSPGGRWLDIAAEQFGLVPDGHPDEDAERDTCVVLSGMYGPDETIPSFSEYMPLYRAEDPSGLSGVWKSNAWQFPSEELVSVVDAFTGSPVPEQCRW